MHAATDEGKERVVTVSSGTRTAWRGLAGLERTKVGEIFGADPRSLAVFRIAMALIVIMDLLARWSSIRVHYTAEGVMPRSLLVESFVRWRWSLNLVNDTYAFQAGLFLVAIAAAVAMMAGYRTRLMTIAVWVLVVSLQARNPWVLSGADSLLRVLLFWSMFLPLGAAWSLDARRQPREHRAPKVYLSFATVGVFLQIAFMYWFTAALKSSPEWRSDGTALYYALGAEHITRPFGEYLYQFPELLRVLTHGSLAIEVVAPILLFSPVWTGPLRTAGIAAIASLHLGIYLTMDVGIFPWTSALCMACFLPAWFWDTLLPAIGRRLPRGLGSLADPVRSVMASAGNDLAALRGRVLHAMTPLAGAGLIGQPSAWPGASQVHPAATDTRRERVTTARSGLHPLPNLFLAGCIVFIFLWNLTSVTSYRLQSETLPFAYGSGLYQKWNMFAPSPSKATVWIVVRGVLADGREVDLLTPIAHGDLTRVPELSWQQPDDIVGDYYGNKYWRKYFTAIADKERTDERRAFAAYACRTWNGHYGGDVRLVAVQVYRMTERTLPDYEDAPTVRTAIAQYRCT
jgi:hypothetical protein